MSVVGLTMTNDESVYINPTKVTSLTQGPAAGESTTIITFAKDDQVIVKGNIDQVAFQLFPDGVR